MTPLEQVQNLAEIIKEHGGKLLLIGGCVRDEIMGLVPKDFDCEAYGLAPEKLRDVLSKFGKIDCVGESFQVYKLGQDIDISLPRRDRKTGKGHKGFIVEGDPFMSYEEACSRRDFTINAIMKDPLTNEIIDPFEGVQDIKAGLLSVVSLQSFSEDSLRVLRLAQFAARFGFDIHEQTLNLAQHTDLSDLPRERVWMELEKLFLKTASENIAYGIECLFKLKIAQKLFPSLKEYPDSHHFMTNAVTLSKDLSEGEKLAILLTVLTYESPINVLDELGVTSVNGYNVRKTVEELLAASHRHVFFNSDYDYHMMSQDVNMRLMGVLFNVFEQDSEGIFVDTVERLGIADEPIKPLLSGKDLIALGMKPSPEMGEILKNAYVAQMRGANKDTLLRKVQEHMGA